MVAIILLAVLGGIVFPAILYYAETHKKKFFSLTAKTISSLTFVALGVICGGHSALQNFARAFIIGEILGAIGDIVLNLWPWVKNTNITFCIGGASFFIGHVFYVTAVGLVNPSGIYLSMLLSVVVFTMVVIMLTKLTTMEKTMRILITLYMLIVSAFFAFSLSAFITQPCMERIILVFGSLLFLFSDFDLMLQNFGKKKSKFTFNCMYVYYPAQVVIALCLYWFV